MGSVRALEQWCRAHCLGYRDVTISNMTTSFRSGLAFCALIHQHRPELIDYESLRKEDVLENNRLAFRVAEEELGIPALLDAEDMVALRIPDRLSILTYVSQYYNYFNGRPPIGGVKRPAQGCREEPSGKKNLPVVAKTFVPKSAAENRSPSAVTARTSPVPARAAVQKSVLTENANKSGTLNSKCAACKSHVHLVQRHFVEGKLYHRSCFKCSECSNMLHVGGYKPGKNPDTFICKAHPSSSRPPSSEPGVHNKPAVSAGRSPGASQGAPAPRPSSVLLTPLDITVKPASATPPSTSWTASAQKTQSARQSFFQATPVAEVKTGDRKPAKVAGVSGSPDDEKTRARTAIGKKLAEENCNNNNKRPFTIRSAGRRFEDEPSSADSPDLRKDKCPAGDWAGRPSSSPAHNKEPPRLKAIDGGGARPTTVASAAKDPPLERQSSLIPVKSELGPTDIKAEAFTGQHEPGYLSSDVSLGETRPPSAPLPAVPPVGLFYSGHMREPSPQESQPGSRHLGFKYRSLSSVKSPPRQPAVESISPSRTAQANDGNPSGAKKGKYLSPTNASRTEMRSPAVKPYHVPAEQIERQLSDIETNLAQLEKEGVELERKLRSFEEEEEGDILMDPLMVDWFNLIRQKQMYIRKESELVYIARTQELEQQQPGVEWELRRLLEKPDHLKSREEQQREKKLMQKLREIVDSRNAIVEGLDEDRRREVEEDKQLNEMMKNLGVKKAKHKRKSSISKLFKRRGKRRVE